MNETEQKQINEQEAGLAAWDEFIAGEFLKAELVKDESESFQVMKQEVVEEKVRISLKKEGMDKLLNFDLNKTNCKFVKEQGITPNGLIGKKIYFNRVMARDPSKNIEVPSLRICKIE